MEMQGIDQNQLNMMVEKCRPLAQKGKTADYIPALQNVNPELLGVCLADTQGNILVAGDAACKFSIQSIVKILIFTCCLLDNEVDHVLQKVSLEPTSDGFNSIKELEMKNDNKPLNPMINAGAIVSLSLVKGKHPRNKRQRILEFARQMSGNPAIDINDEIYQSEKKTASRNRAITYYMQSTGIIEPDIDVEKLLNAYFFACSLNVNCKDLAKIALIYANEGVDPKTQVRLIPREIARVVKATMMMCGMYNESGRIAAEIGLPTKSGVGGGLLSTIPGRMGIGIYGPALNVVGSSIAGLELLKMISNTLDASVF